MNSLSSMRPSISMPTLAIAVLLILHIVGLFGLSFPATRSLFQWLTPIHLLVSLGTLLYFHAAWTSPFVGYLLVVGVLGWSVEVLGVQTGLVFGDYAYGPTLGVKVWDVPLMMAVNWVLVVYMAANIFQPFRRVPLVLRAALGAGLVTGLDAFMEPVAMALDFWDWAGGVVPWQNYLGWFLTAWLMLLAYERVAPDRPNPLALPLFLIQAVFFAILGLFLL